MMRLPSNLEWFVIALLADLYGGQPFTCVCADGRVLRGVRTIL